MWRDDRIQATIDTMIGYVVSLFARRFDVPVHEMQRTFLASKTFALLSDAESGLYHSDIWTTIEMFVEEIKPQILSSESLTPQSHFKYCSLRDPYTSRIFTEKTLWYASPSSFNDSFDYVSRLECNRSTDQEIKTYIEQLHKRNGLECQFQTDQEWESILAETRIGQGMIAAVFKSECARLYEGSSVICFSRRNDSIPMFSSYADGQKGICLEFSFSDAEIPCGFSLTDMLFQRDVIIRDVDYRTDAPELDYVKLLGDTSADKNDLTHTLIFTKPECWKHEEEVRIFRRGVKAGAVPFNPALLKRVILGTEAGDEETALVGKWLNDWPTPVTLVKAEPDGQASPLIVME